MKDIDPTAEDDTFVGFDVDDELEMEDEEIEQPTAPKFDLERMYVIVDPIGRVEMGNEKSAYKFWVTKCLLTERYKYMAYDTDFGIEIEEIIRSNYDREIAESELIRVITEGLMVDERTLGVEDFEFEWNGDSTYVTFAIESVFGREELDLMIEGGDEIVRTTSISST